MYTCPLIPISFPLGVSSNVCKGIGGRGEKGIGRGRGKGKEGQVRGGEEKRKGKKREGPGHGLEEGKSFSFLEINHYGVPHYLFLDAPHWFSPMVLEGPLPNFKPHGGTHPPWSLST